MGSMAVERMQVEGPATNALPGAPGEARAQGLPLSADLQESFGERLDKAVSAASENASTPASNLKTPVLVSTMPGVKTVDSPGKKTPIHATPVLTPDSSTVKQEASLGVRKSSASVLETVGKQPVDADQKDEIKTPVTAPLVESCDGETITVEPDEGLASKNATLNEGSKPVKPEKSVPAIELKKSDSKKGTQSEKIDAVRASSISDDSDLNLPVRSVEQPAISTVIAAGAPTENQVVPLKNSSSTSNTINKNETIRTLPAALSGVRAADTDLNLQVREAASAEDSKGQLRSETTDKSAAATGGTVTIKTTDVPMPGAMNPAVPHGTTSGTMQVSSVPVFSGFEKNGSSDGLARSDLGAGLVTSQDGFGGEGLAAAAVHEASRPVESGLTTTANTLEIGLTHGTHGWLKVRAEMENGLVTASLSSGTATGREMLHRELPALTDFLHQEKLGVSALVVKEASFPRSDGAADGDGAPRQGQPSQQRSERSEHSSENDPRKPVDATRTQETRTVLAGESLFLPAAAVTKGGWLNVRV